MSRRVLVCGYPKSGNTWLTRLTAELIGCPAEGLWLDGGEVREEEIAREGQGRSSEWRVYKSHHTVGELQQTVEPADLVIGIVRDPRDVLISSTHYYETPKHPGLSSFLAKIPTGLRWYALLWGYRKFSREELLHAMLKGNAQINLWLRHPWSRHAADAKLADCLLRYEDLLEEPEKQARRLLEAIGLERTDEQVRRAVERQSFAQRKKQFQDKGQDSQVKFMRSGKARQWRTQLPPELLNELDEAWEEELRQLGYPLSREA